MFPADDIGRALDVVQADPVAAVLMAVHFPKHNTEHGEFGQAAPET